ncbi:MAG: DUF3800 domain-containing protein [Pseudomonadota bacterium]
MILFYYDEVKYNPPDQKSFYLGGVGLRFGDAPRIEGMVNQVANGFFGHSRLERHSEFHGKEISAGKGAFKGVEPEKRLEVYQKLLRIIADDAVIRFYVEILPENLVTPQPEDEVAFMFLVEKINDFLTRHDAVGMIFGDYDEPSIGSSVVSLSQYREGGTKWARAKGIDRLIDTVHFAKSHHSRLIQLADVYLHAKQYHQSSDYSSYWRQQFNVAIRDSGILAVSFLRVWPSEKRWYTR